MKLLMMQILVLALLPLASEAATYEVPVPDQLKNYATFQIAQPVLTRQGRGITVTYRLPAELVGPGFPPLKMRGKDSTQGVFQLRGPNAIANCTQTPTQMSCKMTMMNLNIDNEAVSSFIQSQAPTAQDAKGQLEVAHLFSADPIGILTYGY